MAGSVLARRGVAPLASEPAVVAAADTWLAFAHRGGYATLLTTAQQAARAAGGGQAAAGLAWRRPHGVLHTLRSPADLERLRQRETGYRLERLDVVTYGGTTASAAAFVSSPLLRLRRPVPPRRRYRDLLLKGCAQHSLDPAYTAWLAALEVAEGGQPLPPAYDACPADVLAKALAGGAVGAVAWASLQL